MEDDLLWLISLWGVGGLYLSFWHFSIYTRATHGAVCVIGFTLLSVLLSVAVTAVLVFCLPWHNLALITVYVLLGVRLSQSASEVIAERTGACHIV